MNIKSWTGYIANSGSDDWIQETKWIRSKSIELLTFLTCLFNLTYDLILLQGVNVDSLSGWWIACTNPYRTVNLYNYYVIYMAKLSHFRIVYISVTMYVCTYVFCSLEYMPCVHDCHWSMTCNYNIKREVLFCKTNRNKPVWICKCMFWVPRRRNNSLRLNTV